MSRWLLMILAKQCVQLDDFSLSIVYVGVMILAKQ